MISFESWSEASANLPWGVNQTFKSVLEMAVDEQKVLVYGTDYGVDNATCLVNAAGNLLRVGGGHGVPSTNFGHLVRQFDDLNRHLFNEGVNTTAGKVSPLAAEILLQHWIDVEEPADVPVAPEDEVVILSEKDLSDFLADPYRWTPKDAEAEANINEPPC